MTQQIKVDKRKVDWAWGVERDPLSPDYGHLVTNVILLWKTIPQVNDSGMSAKNLGGAVQHGQRVKVLDERMDSGKLWYEVACTITHDNEQYPQRGWVRASLLKVRGLNDVKQELNNNA